MIFVTKFLEWGLVSSNENSLVSDEGALQQFQSLDLGGQTELFGRMETTETGMEHMNYLHGH